MAIFSINNVALKGISACVPVNSESNLDYDWIPMQDRELLVKTTGILNRRRASEEVFESDLCVYSAKKLLEDSKVKPEEIGILIFVSQSRDYLLPCTATILQDRLGLPRTALAFDVPLGCSGYVYGISIMAALMNSTGISKGLLLAGDASTKNVLRKDKSVYPLFGDAGTATLMEIVPGNVMHFNLQTDGSNYQAIYVPHGGARQPIIEESNIEIEVEKGVIRRKKDLWLNGMDIFNFSVTEVPPNIKELLSTYNLSINDIDYYVLHQANLILNETIRKKLKIAPEKVPYSLKEYGNTSSASIPLTIVANIKKQITTEKHKLLLSGFGVGLSWGSVVLDTENLVIPDIIEV